MRKSCKTAAACSLFWRCPFIVSGVREVTAGQPEPQAAGNATSFKKQQKMVDNVPL
ncbi:hypothetical protein [Paenibacillus chitinolyticus]|uniref:hypothetical protein n=1 Tax=Paenibacillus chitinolyticus TaxID=79263 RepID=UPI00295F0EE4|nr:hypothetical protein [Paenibacillus chitinolyticus]